MRRRSWQNCQVLNKCIGGINNGKRLKIKTSKIKKSTSRSKSSARRISLVRKTNQVENLVRKLRKKNNSKSPFSMKQLDNQTKENINIKRSQILNFKAKKWCSRKSPKKSQNFSKNSRNVRKIYWNSQIFSPNINSNRRLTCKSTPKKIGRRNKNASLSKTQRSIFLTK